jgi:hypothetical protein
LVLDNRGNHGGQQVSVNEKMTWTDSRFCMAVACRVAECPNSLQCSGTFSHHRRDGGDDPLSFDDGEDDSTFALT